MLIAFGHKKSSGKDTAANHLVSHHHFVPVAFADPLKQVLQVMFGFTYQQLWGSQQEKETMDPRWGISPRDALQRLGDGARKIFFEDIWVRAAEQKILPLLEAGKRVVVSDVRYRNEAEMLKRHGGLVVNIARPVESDQHVSEVEMDSWPYEVSVDNTGTKKDLYRKLDQLVRTHDLP